MASEYLRVKVSSGSYFFSAAKWITPDFYRNEKIPDNIAMRKSKVLQTGLQSNTMISE